MDEIIETVDASEVDEMVKFLKTLSPEEQHIFEAYRQGFCSGRASASMRKNENV